MRLRWLKQARKPQVIPEAPDECPKWLTFVALAGRGWGKTRVGAEDTAHFALWTPHRRIAVVGRTFADARDVCVEGESGLLACLPSLVVDKWNRSLGELVLKNGSIIKIFSADKPDKLRGPQFHRAWCDEVAAWQRPESLMQLRYALRLGELPRMIITTTPKPTFTIKELIKNETGKNIIIRGSTFDNRANLSEYALEELKNRYAGTRLGRQELEGEVVDDTEGALWNYRNIEKTRVRSAPRMDKIVVAIDPAATATETSDETGIIVAGRCGSHGYILEDCTIKGKPYDWASVAISAYFRYQADEIVIEVNQGGDMAKDTIKSVNPNVPVRGVRASRGKIIRAQPIASLYEQERVHHVGSFAKLETQLTGFTGENMAHGEGGSPDRMDALVWALTYLMIDTKPITFAPPLVVKQQSGRLE